MKFACPKCGRPDEVIGDENPRCLLCGTELIRATESYKGLWMSPEFVIHRMTKIIQKYGLVAQRIGRFKKEREAWTSAVWALALTRITGREYWVEIETEEATPDTKVHYIDQSTGNNEDMTLNVEVVDWEEHLDQPIQVIRKKCQRAYPGNYFLLVLARNDQRGINPAVLAQEVRGLTVPFAEVWLLGRTGNSVVTVVELHPNAQQLDIDTDSALQQDRRPKQFLVKMKRGTGTAMQDLGSVYLPLP